MPVSRSVRRLLRVLGLEEESRRRDLTSAQGELAQLDAALRAAKKREGDGRCLFTTSVQSEDLRDRLVGQAEVNAGRHRGLVLQQHLHQSNQVVDALRAAFLDKRVERRQAETLVKTADASEALEEDRRTQQTLDTYYLMRPPTDSALPKRDKCERAVKPASDDRAS